MNGPGLPRQSAIVPLVGSQLFTALGDNTLLLVAIALLEERRAAAWMSPALRICLYLSYVVLAPFAGTLADRLPKGRLIVLINLAKLCGCMLLAAGIHPLVAFAAIGLAGVCHGPAKYGILAELVPAADRVPANAWIEAVTVGAILGGAALGAAVLNLPLWLAAVHTATRQASLLLGLPFAVAAWWGRAIPPTACATTREPRPVARFTRQLAALWRDPRGQASLAVTSLFWAVAAVLQFLVIRWAETALKLQLGGAALLQCCLAAGVVMGSLAVVRFVDARAALRVLPAGVVLGVSIMLVSEVTRLWIACSVLCTAGILAGVLVVPMNALLQERGLALMPSGASIAVQGFSENLASLVFLAVYGLLLTYGIRVSTIVLVVGLLVSLSMLLIQRGHLQTSRERDACPLP